jgi:cobalamin-dependent methionine synthase I
VNVALREGLKEMGTPRISKPYECKTYSLGYPPCADLDHALDLVEHLESEEIVRKLSLRK